MLRLAVTVRGVVQGVGFRPLVHAAATRRGLSGWVRNRSDGLALEVQGGEDAVRDFVAALSREAPPAARVDRVEIVPLEDAGPGGTSGGTGVAGFVSFAILPSTESTERRAVLPADLVACAECSAEADAAGARRHRYAFTSCARCGPRHTVVEALPYDRARTTMREFELCTSCGDEYRSETDRRFHAQTIACPACGPALRLVSADGREHASGDAALQAAIAAVCSGGIVAVKGLGGFQLVADATSARAVATLRERKRRPEKPLAVLFASLAAIREACAVSAEEAEWLGSPQGPIVIVERLPDDEARVTVADEVAPGSRRLGVLLPTTPLHRLLAAGAARPLVCTSGNLAGEPICIDDAEARARLAGVADLFLGHERRIVRPVDDSVARVGPAGLVLLRRARGFAPLPLAVDGIPAGIVALGAQLKSTVAVSLDGEVVVSQHLGDLHSADAAALLEWTVGDLLGLFALRPRLVACDLHPDYASTRLAERLTSRWQVPLVRVQHHHAHVAACVAEHGVRAPLGPVGPVIPVLGLAWDGAGLGGDGMLWGGEALLVDGAHFRRVAHLRPFSLPGGERAMREPRRSALGLLHAISAEDAAAWSARRFAPADARVLLAMLARGLGTPTTSVGRLFDAVAALAGVRDVASFEGQAAMELEELADEVAGEASAGPGRARIEPYPLPLRAGARGEPAVADWEPLVREVVHDLARGVPSSVVAARFHASLGELAAAIALRACVPRVALAGGCFQNVRLAREVRARLEARGFEVLAPRVHPPNDAAIALGQVVVAAARERKEEDRVSRDPG